MASMATRLSEMERSIRKGGAKGAGGAKGGKGGGEPPPKYVLSKGKRCTNWDDTGACPEGDKCPRAAGHDQCSMCGKEGHFLKDPNGPCKAKIRAA